MAENYNKLSIPTTCSSNNTIFFFFKITLYSKSISFREMCFNAHVVKNQIMKHTSEDAIYIFKGLQILFQTNDQSLFFKNHQMNNRSDMLLGIYEEG